MRESWDWIIDGWACTLHGAVENLRITAHVASDNQNELAVLEGITKKVTQKQHYLDTT
jgi:hypothetical protein